MRQKYVMNRDGPDKDLTIKEYAIIETKIKKPAAFKANRGKYTFFCEETYKNELILASISGGIKALINILRTHNFYPIEPYAVKIAETVIMLYNDSVDGPVELCFDDVDLMSLDIQRP